jgi:hypothetical protein
LQKEGLPLDVRHEEAIGHRQSEVLSALAAEVAAVHDPDWLLPLDADEFLVSAAGDVRASLAALPRDVVSLLPWRTYIPHASDKKTEGNVLLRMQHRRTEEDPQFSKVLIPAAVLREGRLTLPIGNHEVLVEREGVLCRCPAAAASGLALAHVPVRSHAQLERKILLGWPSNVARPDRQLNDCYHWKTLFEQCKEGSLHEKNLTDIALRYTSQKETVSASLAHDPIPLPRGMRSVTATITSTGSDPSKTTSMLADSAETLALELAASLSLARGTRHHLREQHQELFATRDALNKANTELHRILQTRSWRWMAPLRTIVPMLRSVTQHRGMYRLFGSLRHLWLALGSPFPRTTRFVRHAILGKILPVRLPLLEQVAADTAQREMRDDCDVAVVIICANYGKYLTDAIESVLAQTSHPREIIVVDDASNDETADVAARYKNRDVSYLRGEWRSVGAARNAGLAATTAPYLVFLDADDTIDPDYLRYGLETLERHPAAALAYTDSQCFGLKSEYIRHPETFDWRIFEHQNHIAAQSMVRRDALIQAGGWSHGIKQDGDWVTWRRVMRLGWGAVKSRGIHFYRIHRENMQYGLRRTQYAERSGFTEEPATLCLSLSGRTWAWPRTRAFLEAQEFPHHLLHLVVLDTSQDAVFAANVRSWLATCDYDRTTYVAETVGRRGLADLPRAIAREEVRHASARIYNRFARISTTPLTFFLEDDVIPPLDAYPRLVRRFDHTAVSVSALYKHRHSDLLVAWEWTHDGLPQELKRARGIREAGGNGFGCLALRTVYLTHTVFRSGPPLHDFDYNFYRHLTFDNDLRALLDCECVCDHLLPDDAAVFEKEDAIAETSERREAVTHKHGGLPGDLHQM